MALQKNTLILNHNDFINYTFVSCSLSSGGEVLLDEGESFGEMISRMIDLPSFRQLVVSWNSTTYENTNIEVWIRVRKESSWSQWFSYGKWTTNGYNTGSFSGQKDAFARLDVDQLQLIDGFGDGIQVKVELTRKNESILSPKIRMLAVSITPEKPPIIELYQNQEVQLAVPKREQLNVDGIGNIICSPTSLAMVMEYYGINESTRKVANSTVDNGTSIYGNWSYNVAYAGEKGLEAYVEYCDSINDVQSYVLSGVPIVASIKLKNKEDLEGSFQAYPSGHLVVITGFTRHNGRDCILVNDPATDNVESVPRIYYMDEFIKAWRNIIYVVKKTTNS